MKKPKPPCSMPDCDKLSVARGWCPKHWLRWRKYGDPSVVFKASGEEMARRAQRHGEARHRARRTPEYDAWRSMKQRCYYKNGRNYSRYGGRGITVCDQWRDSYETFLADVGRRPSPQHSLDRIDNNGNYEPGNVRWATDEQQQQNTRRTRVLTIGGESRCIAEWSRISGTEEKTIAERIARGIAPEIAVFCPVRPRKQRSLEWRITIGEVTKRIGEWAAESPITRRSIRERLNRGWPAHEAVFRPRGYSYNRIPLQSERDEMEAA